MLLLGAGPRALLLQIAHPAVAAGVNDHSDFRADPWRRLAGTLRSYLTIVYGSTAAARAEIRRLNTLHRGITGPGYAARDPELSLWVHATLVDSTMAVARCVARTAVAGAPGRVLRRDPADREGVRGAGRAVAAGCRGIRPIRGGHAGPRRAGACLADRPRAGRGHPPAATGAARSAVAAADVRRTIRARARARGDICLDAVAVGGAVAAIGPRRLRPCVGRPRAGRVGLAGRRVPCLATRCSPRPSGRCPRHSPRIGGWATARASS